MLSLSLSISVSVSVSLRVCIFLIGCCIISFLRLNSKIRLWGTITIPVVDALLVVRAGERDELLGDDPVHVSVLHLLVVFVPAIHQVAKPTHDTAKQTHQLSVLTKGAVDLTSAPCVVYGVKYIDPVDLITRRQGPFPVGPCGAHQRRSIRC